MNLLRRLLRRFGFVLVSTKKYEELLFDNENLRDTQKFKKERQKAHVDEYARELFLKRVQDISNPNLYLECRKIAENLYEMENIDWDK